MPQPIESAKKPEQKNLNQYFPSKRLLKNKDKNVEEDIESCSSDEDRPRVNNFGVKRIQIQTEEKSLGNVIVEPKRSMPAKSSSEDFI